MPPGQLLSRAASAGAGSLADADEVVMVRRSAVARCLTCGLCGGTLRDATTVSECLHSFCRKCIMKKYEDEDTTLCPTCSTDLGCDPLEKLRADHSLLCIRLMLFPVKRRKVEEISLLHPALVSPRVHGVCQPAKKTDAFFVGESINGKAEAEAAESLGMELTASPTKSSMYSRSAAAKEVGTFIVTVEKETESTLSSAVGIAAEGSGALPPVASQRETHENIAMTLEKVKIYIGQSQSLQAENARLREELENERAEKAFAVERTRILEEESLQRESNTARMLEMIEACTGQNQALGLANARLREELEMERQDKVAAFDRARVLEGRLQTESEIGQKTEAVREQLFKALDLEIAAQRLLFQDCQALKSEISEKNKERAMLQCDIDTLQKEKICLEYQVDYLTNSLAERTARVSERLDTCILRSQASEAENVRLREELDNERAKGAAANDKTRTLEATLRRESEISQSIEAALNRLLRDYQYLASQIPEETG
ncbi:unnamed protein product [Urochloa decumbens]|uniref:RING-type domain-containing protein n=1 Tax=Urochloa decumbens TaxID=240449 RepID=A0ABC9HC01_9POAL